jgi:hypothetical protein
MQCIHQTTRKIARGSVLFAKKYETISAGRV